MKRSALAIVLVCALVPLAHAQQVPIHPASTHIFPAGGRQGTIVNVRVGGELLPPGTKIQFLDEGVAAPPVLGEAVTGAYEQSLRRNPLETPMSHAKEWASTVTVAVDAPPGQKLWRLTSGRGGTGARPFVVGQLPEMVESESNSSPERAEQVTLPVTINGQIAGERDVDYFQFTVEAGDVITADVAAARLGSPLETTIEIHDTAGHRVRAQELRAGSDPVLVFKAPADGTYRLFVANLSFRGGSEFVYRITLTRLPYVAFTFPSTVSHGAPIDLTTYRVFGDGRLTPMHESLPAVGSSGLIWLSTATPAANPISLTIIDGAACVENEPNSASDDAQELSIESTVCGQLSTPADEDWFRFTTARDQLLSIDCAPPKGSPALPIVSVVDAAGAIAVSAKSAETADRVCRLDWRAPTDGPFYLRVADNGQGAVGGPEFMYSLTLKRAVPNFSLSAKADILNVVQGERSELEIAIVRRGGFERPIELTIEGLPKGVRFEPHELPAKQDTAKIAFIADAETRPGTTTLKLTGNAAIDGQNISRVLTASHLGHDAEGIGIGSSTIGNLQLTVAHKPVFKLSCNEAYQYAHRGTLYPYQMEIERLDGFNGPIHLEVADRQIKDLDGAQLRETTVEPGQTTFMMPLYFPETMHVNMQAHSNIYAQGFVKFIDKWGQEQSHLVVSTMRCMVRTMPPVAKLQSIDRSLVVKPGGKVTCRLELIRTSNFAGPARIELVRPTPSDGFSASAVELPAGVSTATIVVHFVRSEQLRQGTSLIFRATGTMAHGAQLITEASVPVSLVLQR